MDNHIFRILDSPYAYLYYIANQLWIFANDNRKYRDEAERSRATCYLL